MVCIHCEDKRSQVATGVVVAEVDVVVAPGGVGDDGPVGLAELEELVIGGLW